eukprot:CAMPEP_0171497618 /NCGR_PEP_ID=MMETSP0958-20121227/7375_1 /TAXON_ID=87120 /ORGANISM="Aurantiochytrium limacinum, Strain ATCCMYA-1381" /LENGTH=171 /DNA_ID=CAMNT_0012031887 /DNA_START=660 /DNA_END=1176 /DNA_ORIENTATION=-
MSSFSDEGRGGAGLVAPGGGKVLGALVVAGKTVNAGLEENEGVLGAGVTAVALEVLAHGDSLLNEEVEVLRELSGKTVLLQNTGDLVAEHALDLGNTVGVTEDDTDLGRVKTLLGELAALLLDLLRGDLEPAGRGALVRQRAAADALAVAVDATHLVFSSYLAASVLSQVC